MQNVTKILIGGALIMLAYFTLFAPSDAEDAASTESEEAPARITFAKDSRGIVSYVINSKGRKQQLDFGTFVSVCTEEMLGKKLSECKPTGSVIKIFNEKDSQGNLTAYILDAQGQKKEFLLPNLFASLPGLLDCGDQMQTQPKAMPAKLNADRFVQIFFDKDIQGDLQAHIVHVDGMKELLNLGNLLAATAELTPNCTVGTEKNRAIYVVFDSDPSNSNELVASQVDAFGQKSQLNADDLITAAVQSLMVCSTNKNKPLASAPKAPFLKITFEKEAKGRLKSILTDSKGKSVGLNLGTLLDAAVAVRSCTAEQLRDRSVQVSFEKSSDGSMNGFIIDAEGNKLPFNFLGELINAAVNMCAQK